jgi:hypothetical protein
MVLASPALLSAAGHWRCYWCFWCCCCCASITSSTKSISITANSTGSAQAVLLVLSASFKMRGLRIVLYSLPLGIGGATGAFGAAVVAPVSPAAPKASVSPPTALAARRRCCWCCRPYSKWGVCVSYCMEGNTRCCRALVHSTYVFFVPKATPVEKSLAPQKIWLGANK